MSRARGRSARSSYTILQETRGKQAPQNEGEEHSRGKHKAKEAVHCQMVGYMEAFNVMHHAPDPCSVTFRKAPS